jgi:hypothetical protein
MELGGLTIQPRHIRPVTQGSLMFLLHSTVMYSYSSGQHPISLTIVGDPTLSLSYFDACK